MIDDVGVQIVAPFGKVEDKLRRINFSGINRKAMRRLQPFLVTLYRQEIDILRKVGAIAEISEDCGVWRVPRSSIRSTMKRFGFRWQGPIAADPEALMA